MKFLNAVLLGFFLSGSFLGGFGLFSISVEFISGF